jgi:hypothetical protein
MPIFAMQEGGLVGEIYLIETVGKVGGIENVTL